jgi:type VII secretion integral membrane protein EccD
VTQVTATISTGLARVTLVAPDCRVDVVLPEEVPLAELYPEILRLSGQVQADGAATGFHLMRLDGTVLDGSTGLHAQGVRDGELLRFTPLADSLPPPVYDDVSDSIATSLTQDRRLWTPAMLHTAGLSAAAFFFSLGAVVLWRMAPLPHGLPGIVAASLAVLLTVIAGVRARVYADSTAGAILGIGALPNAFLAGLSIIKPPFMEGLGRVQFLSGAVTLMVVATLIALLVPQRNALFVAAAGTGAAGGLASFGLIATDSSPVRVAAVAAVVAVALLGFLPGWSARSARLPIGFLPTDAPAAAQAAQAEAVDHADIAERARRGHEVLTGLVGACATVVVCASIVLGDAHGNKEAFWAQILTAVVGLLTLSRSRLFRHSAQVVILFSAGLTAMAFLFIGLTLHTGFFDSERQGWIFAMCAVIGALLALTAVTVPARGLSPFWGRLTDIAESLMLCAAIPICLAVMDVYSKMRGITS